MVSKILSLKISDTYLFPYLSSRLNVLEAKVTEESPVVFTITGFAKVNTNEINVGNIFNPLKKIDSFAGT